MTIMTRSQAGVGVAIAFVASSVAAQLLAARLIAAGHLVRPLDPAFLYLVSGLAAVTHCGLWLAYSAALLVSLRTLAGRPRYGFKELLGATGMAHAPLLVWAILVAASWWWLPPSDVDHVLARARVMEWTRTAAYGAGICMIALIVARTGSLSVLDAALCTCAPACAIGLVMIMINWCVAGLGR